MSFDLGHLWSTMSWINKGVAILLVVMAFLLLVVAIERAIVFARATRQSAALARKLSPLLANNQLEEALALAGEPHYKTSYLGPIVKQGLTAFMTRRNQRGTDAIAAAKRAIDKAISLEDLGLRRGVSIVATIASSAPFVGLFGTVFGIINAFTSMSVSGEGGIGAVSAGIAEALVATGFGLFVAIPATWVFNYFLSRLETMSTEMSVSTTELIDFCINQLENSAA